MYEIRLKTDVSADSLEKFVVTSSCVIGMLRDQLQATPNKVLSVTHMDA